MSYGPTYGSQTGPGISPTPSQQQQMMYQQYAAQQGGGYGGGAYQQQYGHNPYGQQSPQQHHGQPPYVQPGTVAYTERRSPDGGVVYEPVVAQEVAVSTPQGVVKTIQYVPAGGASNAGTPPPPGVSYGVQSSQMAFPSYGQAPPPGSMGQVPGVAYDMRTYGDAFAGQMSAKDYKKERKRLEKERLLQEKERAVQEKEQRKQMERAARKQQEWAGSRRERERAEEEQVQLVRARERDRERERERGRGRDHRNHDYDDEEEEEPERYGIVSGSQGGRRSRRPSMSGPGLVQPLVPGMGGIGGMAYDPAIEAKLAGLNMGSGTRSRRTSDARRMIAGPQGGSVDLTYGGAPLGANGMPGMPGGPAGMVPGAMGMPGSMGMAGSMPMSGGLMPGDAANGGYVRERRGSQAGRLVPSPAPQQNYLSSPVGAVVAMDGSDGMGGRMGMGRSPHVPISQIPPSPGGRVRSNSAYGHVQAPGQGAMGAAGANIAGYTAQMAFTRQPSASGGMLYSPFETFEVFHSMDDMLTMLPNILPLPRALVDHDVLWQDWARWMTDLVSAWKKGQESRDPEQSRGMRMLVDAWNHNFFLRRAVYFRLSKVRKPPPRRKRRSARDSRYGGSQQDYSEDDSDSMSSEEDSEEEEEDDDEYGQRYDEQGRRRGDRRRDHRRRRHEEKVYRLVCEYIPPNHGPAAAAMRPGVVASAPGIGYPGSTFP